MVAQINDYVNYGSSGICKVIDISCLSFGRKPERREYYVLLLFSSNHQQSMCRRTIKR